MKLRPYQQDAVEAVYRHLRTRDDNPCVAIPTAGGKTPVMASICRDAVTCWGGRVLVLAHVKELLEQTADKLTQVCPDVQFGMYSAGLKRRDTTHSVIVAGIQSVYASLRAKLRYSQDSPAGTQDQMFCWHCRYFQPDDELSLSEPWTDEALPGECRCNPPVVGDLMVPATRDEHRWFGNFPRVMASDWCGRLVVRDVGPQRGELDGASTDVGIEPNGHR